MRKTSGWPQFFLYYMQEFMGAWKGWDLRIFSQIVSVFKEKKSSDLQGL